MATQVRIPEVVRCDWMRVKNPTVKGTRICTFCGSNTANYPLYKYSVCPIRDRRRSDIKDRRQS